MIVIYEPIYRPGQVLSEPAFVPLRIENTRPAWREFAIIVDMFRQGLHCRQKLTGLFSPKFGLKTGVSGADFISFIEASPTADVYVLNRPAHLPYYSFNVWMEGEYLHPGLTSCGQALLDAAGIDWRLSETGRQGPNVVCYNNFWVGTESFWENYVGGVLIPIAEFLEAHPASDVARSVLAATVHRDPAPFLPFIIERLFSTYVSRARPAVVPYLRDPLQSCLLDYERDLVAFMRERVTRADDEGHFPPDLIAWMHLMCRLQVRYRLAYYSQHVHPFDGKLFDPGLAAIGLAGLDTIPPVSLPC